MSKMIQLVEEMRVRMGELTESEQTLVRALGEALSLVDQKLLADVRNIGVEHESRRGLILHELQSLASRIGAFPAPREPMTALPFSEPVTTALPFGEPHRQTVAHAPAQAPAYAPAHAPAYAPAHTPANANEPTAFANEPSSFTAGDWRQAASNIEDELDLFCKRVATN